MNALQSFRESYRAFGNRPEAVQWSPDGQMWRFDRLYKLATDEHDLTGASVLDIGCGLGHLYEFLTARAGKIHYTGVDIVPEFVLEASHNYPEAHFKIGDARAKWHENYDFVFISGLFNAPKMQKAGQFLFDVISNAYSHSRKALVFNFTSCNNNFTDPQANYFNPGIVLEYCMANLSQKVAMHHHYRNCDVSFSVQRP